MKTTDRKAIIHADGIKFTGSVSSKAGKLFWLSTEQETRRDRARANLITLAHKKNRDSIRVIPAFDIYSYAQYMKGNCTRREFWQQFITEDVLTTLHNEGITVFNILRGHYARNYVPYIDWHDLPYIKPIGKHFRKINVSPSPEGSATVYFYAAQFIYETLTEGET